MSPLVSIMTPCYNGEKFVGRYLDSVLAQTYDNIEVVLVDSSTDDTEKIIRQYIPLFEKKGYTLHYIYQKKEGLAAAISLAMKNVTGDFISWFDADDILLPESTEKRVNFLLKNPQYDFCMCQMYSVDEKDTKTVKSIVRRIPPPVGEKDTLFMDFIIQRNVIFPNVWLVRRDVFFKAHPTKSIYPCHYGQNWQLILPLAYNFKCGYINEPLCYYVQRQGSIMHTKFTLQQEVEKRLEFIDLLTATIKPLNVPNETELLNFIWVKFMHQNLMLGIYYGDTDLIVECIKAAAERKINIFGADTFDVAFLLENYILPKMELQNKLNAVQADIAALNDKIKNI